MGKPEGIHGAYYLRLIDGFLALKCLQAQWPTIFKVYRHHQSHSELGCPTAFPGGSTGAWMQRCLHICFVLSPTVTAAHSTRTLLGPRAAPKPSAVTAASTEQQINVTGSQHGKVMARGRRRLTTDINRARSTLILSTCCPSS